MMSNLNNKRVAVNTCRDDVTATADPHIASKPHVTSNPWQSLRHLTDARIGLGRAGISIPTKEMLAFQLAHAQARDAVHLPLDIVGLRQQLSQQKALPPVYPTTLQSQAIDRNTYLQRPDLGRCLDTRSRADLNADNCNDDKTSADMICATPAKAYDLALIIVDGLSSHAIQQHAAPFLQQLCSLLAADKKSWSLAPITLVQQGRVAIADEIGALLNARASLVLIGERPGLSSPDSLGLYLTRDPQPGLTDAQRNCISNIRPAGLSYTAASHRAAYLLQASRQLKLTGVQLKDRSEDNVIEHQDNNKNFLIAPSHLAER